MLKEAKNNIVIEGILAEVDLRDVTYVSKGIEKEGMRGNIKVRVTQAIDGEEVQLDIPVNIFSPKYKNDGGSNPSYANLDKIRTDMISLAAADTPSEATMVRITNGKVQMNEYYTPDGRFVTFPRLMTSFINTVSNEKDFQPKATWAIEGFIKNMDYVADKDGVDTDTFKIDIVVVGFNEYADVIPIVTRDKSFIDSFRSMYDVGETVPLNGYLNFSSKVETYTEPVALGNPEERTRTINVSELIIAGCKAALDEGYEVAEIKKVCDERTKRIALLKEKAGAKASKGEARAPSGNSNKKADLGF